MAPSPDDCDDDKDDDDVDDKDNDDDDDDNHDDDDNDDNHGDDEQLHILKNIFLWLFIQMIIFLCKLFLPNAIDISFLL